MQQGAIELHGSVIDMQTGLPLAGAEVRVWREAKEGEVDRSGRVIDAETPWAIRFYPLSSVTTDESGKFRLSRIAEGAYHFGAVARGYVPQEFGYAVAGETASVPANFGYRGSAVVVKGGDILPSIDFRLSPEVQYGVISGRVIGEKGEPLWGVSVELHPLEFNSSGARVIRAILRNGIFAISNDLGEFRLSNIRPGYYYLAGAISQGLTGTAARIPRERVHEFQAQGYVFTYYPRALSMNAANLIKITAGSRLSIDIPLIRQSSPLLAIRGRVVDETGSVPRLFLNKVEREDLIRLGAVKEGDSPEAFALKAAERWGDRAVNKVSVARVWDNREQSALASVDYRDGTFEVSNLKPGRYRIGGYATLQLEDRDINDLVLTIPSGGTLEGALAVEQPNIAAATFDRLDVILQSVADGQDYMVTKAKADGHFSFRNVRAGEYRVVVRGPDSDVWVSRMAFDGRDVSREGTFWYAGDSRKSIAVEVRFTGGVVRGSTLNANGGRVTNSCVVLVPENLKRVDLYKSTTSDHEGNYLLRGISPGKYRIYSWDLPAGPGCGRANEYFEPKFLIHFAGRFKELSIAEVSTAETNVIAVSRL